MRYRLRTLHLTSFSWPILSLTIAIDQSAREKFDSHCKITLTFFLLIFILLMLQVVREFAVVSTVLMILGNQRVTCTDTGITETISLG